MLHNLIKAHARKEASLRCGLRALRSWAWPIVIFGLLINIKYSSVSQASLDVHDDLLSATKAHARILGDEGGSDRGTHGKAGSCTEQFALGSVLYALTYGHDPFEDEWWGPDHCPTKYVLFA